MKFEEKPGRSRSSRRPAWVRSAAVRSLATMAGFAVMARSRGEAWRCSHTRRVLTNQRAFHITPCIVLPATEDRSAEPVIAHRGLRAFTYGANLQRERVAAIGMER